MAVYPFKLLFDPPRTKPLPDTARARIALGVWSTESEGPIVYPECRTVHEVKEAVDYLKKDLDRVLAEARRKFPSMQGGAG